MKAQYMDLGSWPLEARIYQIEARASPWHGIISDRILILCACDAYQVGRCATAKFGHSPRPLQPYLGTLHNGTVTCEIASKKIIIDSPCSYGGCKVARVDAIGNMRGVEVGNPLVVEQDCWFGPDGLLGSYQPAWHRAGTKKKGCLEVEGIPTDRGSTGCN